MSDIETTKEIISICMEVDVLARDTYAGFAMSTEDTALREFWRRMTREEFSHVRYWRELASLACDGALPGDVFPDPDKTAAEMRELRDKAIAAQTSSTSDLHDRFLAAFRLEFYMLHNAFSSLFMFLKKMPDSDRSPADDYDEHIRAFIGAMREIGASTPVFELLSETISALWEENKTLVHQSTVDPLTGLLNRSGFLQVAHPLLHLAARGGQTVAILMADVDDFKKVNDTHGHVAGDAALRGVAETIRASVRRSDVSGRFGGEEFIVLLPGVEPGGAARVAEKIRAAVESRGFGAARVTISVGAAETIAAASPDEIIGQLVRRADDALYIAKKSGKNRVASK